MSILTRVKHALNKIPAYRSFSVFAILVGLAVVFWVITPEHKFLSTPVLNILLEGSPTVAIVTVAMALLLISGEFDLSVGSIFVLAASVMAILYTNYGVDPAVAILVGLALGGLCGFVNGVLVTKLGISSLIVTLGTMWTFRGIAYVITNGCEIPYYPERTSPIFLNFFCGKIWTIPAQFLGPTIPAQFLWLIVVTIFLWVLLEHTKLGNWIFATGSNKESARMMGINTNRTKIICFIIVGILSAFGGIIQATRYRIADPSAVQTLNLEAIAGAVVGGTSLYGGVGSILGAVLGALCIRVLSIGLTMMGLSPYHFQIATGALLVAAVAINIKIKQKTLRR